MDNYWPYTDVHQLNLDWILKKVKELDSEFNETLVQTIEDYIEEHLSDFTVSANYDQDTDTIVYTNGTHAATTIGDVVRFAIDEVFVDVKDAVARGNIGTLANLTTVDKTNLVAAINEVQTYVDNVVSNQIGNITDLQTTASDLVGAVNEVNGRSVSNASSITDLYNVKAPVQNPSVQWEMSGTTTQVDTDINHITMRRGGSQNQRNLFIQQTLNDNTSTNYSLYSETGGFLPTVYRTIISIDTVSVSTSSSVNAQATGTLTGTYTKRNANSTVRMLPLYVNYGAFSAAPSLSGTTVSVQARNYSSAAHSLAGVIVVIETMASPSGKY